MDLKGRSFLTLKDFTAEEIEYLIMFSCHTREKVMADKLGLDYHLKKLD